MKNIPATAATLTWFLHLATAGALKEERVGAGHHAVLVVVEVQTAFGEGGGLGRGREALVE